MTFKLYVTKYIPIEVNYVVVKSDIHWVYENIKIML